MTSILRALIVAVFFAFGASIAADAEAGWRYGHGCGHCQTYGGHGYTRHTHYARPHYYKRHYYRAHRYGYAHSPYRRSLRAQGYAFQPSNAYRGAYTYRR